jgi:DNA polymerase III delta prime subunit
VKLINPKTKVMARSFIENPSHALILHGERGAGQNILALEIAEETSQTPIKDLQTANRLMILESQDKKNISLEQIKPIKSFFERKISKKGRLARIVIIQSADLMSLEAQNSLLKILEGELNSDNLIILSCANLESLIGPIHSRCQKIIVLPISLSQIYKSYPNHDKGELKKIFHMTRGLSENFANQISQDGLEKAELKQAKLFLSENRAKKLKIVVNLINNKEI